MFRCRSLKSIATKLSTKPSISSSSSAPALQSINSNSNLNHNHNPNFSSRDNNNNNKDEEEDDDPSPTSRPELDDPQSSLSLTREYDLVVQADSYTEIRSRVVVHNPQEPDPQQLHHHHHHHHNNNNIVSPLLLPNRHSVQDALRRAPPTKLTRLVSTYFDHSEHTSSLLWSLLNQSLQSAYSLYSPLHSLLDVLPISGHLSPPQCDRLLDLFRDFLNLPNPFPSPSTTTFLHDTRRSFSDLRHQLDRRVRRAQSLSRFPRSAALCIGYAFKRPAHITLPSQLVKRQLGHIAQLDAAAVGAYVVNIELDTINCLVEKLYDAVESDRFLIRFGVERGGRDNRFPIQEAVKHLRKNRANLVKQMEDLEEHVCICLASVNRARARLLEEIHRQQT